MAEKPNVWTSLIAMIFLISGFVLFILRRQEMGVGLTLIGVIIYIFTKFKISDDS